MALSSYLSQVRRIDRVVAPEGERGVALVFEDGPTGAAPRPDPGEMRWRGNGPSGQRRARDGAGITETLLDLLESYRASATFAVIGSTGANYPDEPAGPGLTPGGGLAYDHYPEFGQDALGGVVSQGGTARRMIASGHELCNHSYRHIPLGASPGRTGRRVCHPDPESALKDLCELHDYVRENLGCEMRLGRPPQLIEGPVFDLYRALGYDYVGLGLDGGGWGPSSGRYDNDVEVMVLGLQRRLEKNGRALAGWVVSFKEGYDQAGRSPLVTALPRILQLFRNYGYRLSTVSALVETSPFADLGPDHPAFGAVRHLLKDGWWVAYRSNEVRPDAPVLRGDLAVWSMGPTRPPIGPADGVAVYADVPIGHPYRWHIEEATGRGFWRGLGGKGFSRPSDPEARGSRVFGWTDAVSLDEFRAVMDRAGVAVPMPEGGKRGRDGLDHAEALVLISEAVGGE